MNAGRRSTRAMLLETGVPVVEISLPVLDAANLGSLMMLLMGVCAIKGTISGIDPFNQPGVELGKAYSVSWLLNNQG